MVRQWAQAFVLAIFASNAFAYTIKGPENPEPWEATAVQELKDYLARRVRLADNVTVGGRAAVTFHVGDTAFAAMKGLSSKAMAEEFWTIRSFGGDVVLNGGGTRGCLYAVYHFLEDFCGVRWWSDTEEDILDSGALALPALNVSGKPAMFLRSVLRSHNPKVVTARQVARRRLNSNYNPIPLSLGGSVSIGPPSISHTFEHYLPYEKYGKTHPEYFAVNRKWKAGAEGKYQLCLSQPDVRRILLEGLMANIEKSAAEAKAAGRLPPRIFALSKNDNEYFCECPGCAAETAKYGHSGFHLNVINPIAAEVAKKHPDVYILTSAYLYTEAAPKGGVRAAPNVGISFCPLGVNFAAPFTAPFKENEKARANLDAWKKCADIIMVWDYAITFGRDTLDYPLPNEWFFGEKYKYYAARNVKGIQWEQQWVHLSDLSDLKCYWLSKLSEDPSLDYPSLLRRTYNEFFGPEAGPLVYASREHLRDVQRRCNPWVGFMPGHCTFDFIADADVEFMSALYDKAEKAVVGDARYLRRLKRARSGLDSLAARRKSLFVRDTFDGKPCWVANPDVFGTPHRINAYRVTDPDAPTGKAVELAKKPGHVSPLQILYHNSVTKKSSLVKQLAVPDEAREYTWFDVGRVTLEKGGRFLMTKSFLAQVYTPQEGDLVGKSFDVKLLAKITPKGQIRLGRMVFIPTKAEFKNQSNNGEMK